jgi:hypothetical protein
MELSANIDVEHLGALTEIGRGGQGRVFAVADSRIVYKEYSAATLPEVNVEALKAAVALITDLGPRTAQDLYARTAWPMATVEREGKLIGFLMRAVPDAYRIQLTLPTGQVSRPAGVQYLLNTDEYLEERGLRFTDRMRLELLRDTAETLDRLHGLGIAVGDLSPNNLLFSLVSRPRCLFIDCDGMRIRGTSIMPQSETTDWDVGGVSDEELATPASDTYKFALLAIRLFAGDQQSRNPNALATSDPKLAELAAASLSRDPGRRPPLSEWVATLDAALGVRAPDPVLETKASWWGAAAVIGVIAGVAAIGLAIPALTDNPAEPPPPTASTAAPAPKAPARVGLVDVSAVAGDERGAAVAGTFDGYFAAINAGDYDRAINQLDPTGQLAPATTRDRQKFRDDLTGTAVADVRLTGLGAGSGAPAVVSARLTYRTTQPAGKGPPDRRRETCTRWAVTYDLSGPAPGQYRIVRATATTTSPC